MDWIQGVRHRRQGRCGVRRRSEDASAGATYRADQVDGAGPADGEISFAGEPGDKGASGLCTGDREGRPKDDGNAAPGYVSHECDTACAWRRSCATPRIRGKVDWARQPDRIGCDDGCVDERALE